MTGDPISESAKAVQETAKATSKAIDLTSGFTGWIGEVVGRPIAEAVGLLVTDRLAAKRVEASIYDAARLQSLLEKTRSYLADRSAVLREIEPKIALPLLEAATMEFDERLHDLWAELLASAIDNDTDPVQRQYVSILTDLSADDAEALEYFWKESFSPLNLRPHSDGPVTFGPSIDTGAYGEHISANLIRLGLFRPALMKIKVYQPEQHDHRYGSWGPSEHPVDVPGEAAYVTFTELGVAFCRAVGMREPSKAGTAEPVA